MYQGRYLPRDRRSVPRDRLLPDPPHLHRAGHAVHGRAARCRVRTLPPRRLQRPRHRHLFEHGRAESDEETDIKNYFDSSKTREKVETKLKKRTISDLAGVNKKPNGPKGFGNVPKETELLSSSKQCRAQ